MRRFSVPRSRVVILACFLLPLAAACTEQEVATNLSSSDSIEITVALDSAGISASREKVSTGRNVQYRVLVPESSGSRALRLLHEYGLPRAEEGRIEEITKGNGFAPLSPDVSQFRLDYARGLQLESLLRKLPSVIDAKVIVGGSSSASIVLRYRSQSGKPLFTDDEVRQIAVKTIPSLSPSEVLVSKHRVYFGGEPVDVEGENAMVRLRPFQFRVRGSERKNAVIQVSMAMVLVFIGGGVLGYLVSSGRRVSNRSHQRRPQNARSSGSLLDSSAGRSGPGQMPSPRGDSSGRPKS